MRRFSLDRLDWPFITRPTHTQTHTSCRETMECRLIQFGLVLTDNNEIIKQSITPHSAGIALCVCVCVSLSHTCLPYSFFMRTTHNSCHSVKFSLSSCVFLCFCMLCEHISAHYTNTLWLQQGEGKKEKRKRLFHHQCSVQQTLLYISLSKKQVKENIWSERERRVKSKKVLRDQRRWWRKEQKRGAGGKWEKGTEKACNLQLSEEQNLPQQGRCLYFFYPLSLPSTWLSVSQLICA